MGCRHAVREAGVDLERRSLQEFGGEACGVLNGDDLVVVAVHQECRDVDGLEVIGEVGF